MHSNTITCVAIPKANEKMCELLANSRLTTLHISHGLSLSGLRVLAQSTSLTGLSATCPYEHVQSLRVLLTISKLARLNALVPELADALRSCSPSFHPHSITELNMRPFFSTMTPACAKLITQHFPHIRSFHLATDENVCTASSRLHKSTSALSAPIRTSRRCDLARVIRGSVVETSERMWIELESTLSTRDEDEDIDYEADAVLCVFKRAALYSNT
jgi:hypothetical protein